MKERRYDIVIRKKGDPRATGVLCWVYGLFASYARRKVLRLNPGHRVVSCRWVRPVDPSECAAWQARVRGGLGK